MTTSSFEFFKGIYPKELPLLDKRSHADQLGFTAVERSALKMAFIKFNRNIRRHAIKINIEFFEEREHLLERFRDPRTRKFRQEALVRHPVAMLREMGEIINNLENLGALRSELIEMFGLHKSVGVSREEFVVFGETALNYILRQLDNQSSTSLTQAAKKLILFMANYNE